MSSVSSIGFAAVAEVYLVILAIEENTRASAAAAHASAQALQKQAEMAAALTTITQNTRYAADDLLRSASCWSRLSTSSVAATRPSLACQAAEGAR